MPRTSLFVGGRAALQRPLVAAALCGVLLAGALVVLGQPSVAAAPPAQRESPCGCAAIRVVAPDGVRMCESAQITLGVRPSCPGSPIHIVLIIDEVYKPGFSNPRDRTDALRNAINRLELDKNPHIRVGVVWMQDGSAHKRLDLTNRAQDIIANLDVPPVSRFQAPPQCFECGYREAIRLLDRGKKDFPASTDILEITVLAPLGVYNPSSAPGILQGANQVKARRATSMTTCFAWTHCDPVLQRAASETRFYLGYGEGNRLAAILHDVVRSSVATFLRGVTVSDRWPEGMSVDPASISPDAASVDAAERTITWAYTMPISDTYTLTYRVRPEGLGSFAFAEGHVAVQDSQYRNFEVDLPTGELTVAEECPVAVTPTATPTAPATPTPPPTRTTVPTPAPKPIYLPMVIREECRDRLTHADVALVLDMSTSMRQPGADGRSKVEAAMAAARAFVADMHLAPDPAGQSDRVAVVGFNRTAWIEQGLTSDAAALGAALDRLPLGMVEHTRIDLGVARGGDALADAAPGRSWVMILLTDGLPNQVPYAEDGTMDTTILRAASTVKARGIEVYTVGLGRSDGPQPEINPGLLRAVASRPEAYFAAPDAGDLAGIYAGIAEVIPCGGVPTWPDPR